MWNAKMKLIAWAHCPFKSKILYFNSISRVVCVGNEQRDEHKNALNSHKLTVIFNALNLDVNTTYLTPFANRKAEVTFMGALMPFKGFHVLAKAWKDIVSLVPDAHLNVIGSGRLYDRNAPLGKWDIASPEYEELFMPYLLDDNGQILPSVTFWGVLDDEKNKILGETKVGVPNPLGRETFCISAVEMQMYGALVTTIKEGGYIDTVYDQDSLFEHNDDLAIYVATQLKKTENKDYNACMEYFENNFSFETTCNKWNDLFDIVEQEKEISIFKYLILAITYPIYLTFRLFKLPKAILKRFIS